MEKKTTHTTGLTVTRIEAGGIAASEYDYSDLTDSSPLPFPLPAIIYVEKGIFYIGAEGKKFYCKAGDAIYVAACMPLPVLHARGVLKYLSLPVNAAVCDCMKLALPVQHTHVYLRKTGVGAVMHVVMNEFLENDSESECSLSNGFRMAVVLVGREKEMVEALRSPRWVKIMRSLLVHKNAGMLSRDYLAKMTGKDADYISKEFPKYFHCPLKAYILRIKMEQAVVLLSDHLNTPDDVSDLCGYSHPGHFYKVFLKYYSVTPAEYRDSLEDVH